MERRKFLSMAMAGASAALGAAQGGQDMGYPKLTPITATGATEPRYLKDRFTDIFSAKDFGAKGDGQTEDTSSIGAINTFKTNNPNSPIIFNAGLYKSDNNGESIFAGKTTIQNIEIEDVTKTFKQKPNTVHFVHDEPTYTTYALNGSVCYDGFLYSVYVTDNQNTSQVLQRINLSTGYIDFLDSNENSLAVVEHTDLGHANSMTCDGNYLYVLPGIESNANVYKIDMQTLQTVSVYDISESVGNGSGIAYNEKNGFFYINSYTDGFLHVLNSSFSQVATCNIEHPSGIGMSLQDICFKDGELYGFIFGNNSTSPAEYHNYIVKFGVDGKYTQTWLLDIYREVENLSVYNDDFLVGVNSSYGERYDYYKIKIDNNRIMPADDITLIDKKVDDCAGSLVHDAPLWCKKRQSITVGGLTSSYKLVGSGHKGDEFNYLEDAIVFARNVDKLNFYNGQLLFLLSGDFSDKSYEISGFKTKVTFTTSDAVESNPTAKVGPLIIKNSKAFQLWSETVSVELTATNETTEKCALYVDNSYMLLGANIENKTTVSDRIGIIVGRGAYIDIVNNINIKSFGIGVDLVGGSFVTNNNSSPTFTNCTKNFSGSRLDVVRLNRSLGYDIVNNYTGSIERIFGDLLVKKLRVAEGSDGFAYLYRRGAGTNYRGITLSVNSPSGNSTIEGASLTLRDANSPSEAGIFLLTTKDSSTSCSLVGTSSGTLKWDGQTIATSSDERLKTTLEELPQSVLDAWGSVQWGQFKFLDAVKEKGENARLHTGLIAQKVKAVFEERNIDACRYGILCHDEWDDEYIEETVVDSPETYNDKGDVVAEAVTHIERRLNKPAGDKWNVRYEEALAMECIYLRSRISKMQEQIDILVERVNQLTNNSNK